MLGIDGRRVFAGRFAVSSVGSARVPARARARQAVAARAGRMRPPAGSRVLLLATASVMCRK